MGLTCILESVTPRHHISMLRQHWLSQALPEGGEPDAQTGVCYLPDLSVVRFEGSDAGAFLQGYLTCDTQALSSTSLQPAAVCNLKGRVVFNGWCILANDTESGPVDLIVHRTLAPRVASFLEAYLRFSRTSLRDMADDVLVFGYVGDRPPSDTRMVSDEVGLLLVESLEAAERTWQELPHVPAGTWRARLLDAGWPLVSAATSESFLLQMLDLDRLGAISFDKGCYLGQEIVARAQHRGKVKRRLTRLSWSGPQTPAAGAEVTSTDETDRSWGTLVDAAPLSDHHGTCLAVVADDAPDPLRAGECELRAAS